MRTRRLSLLSSSVCAVLAIGGVNAGSSAYAESPDADALLKMMEDLQRQLREAKAEQKKTAEQLEELKGQLRKNTASVEKVAQETEQARQETKDVQAHIETLGSHTPTKAESDGEEGDAKSPEGPSAQTQSASSGPVFQDTLWHIAGFADANYRATTGDEDREGKINSFLSARFNPVFHFLYKDLLLFEGELEFEVGADGETEVALEYASIDWLATDYATLVFGQFLSPVGYFQQNIHPTWINKLPLAPPGFGHGGVAPASDLGVMVRGGIELPQAFEHDGAEVKPLINYAVYVGNGPQLMSEGGDLEALEQEAFGQDDNNNKAIGGRVGVVPIPHLELGASFLVSDVLGKKEEGVLGPVSEGRYTIWGADFGYTRGPWNIRAEYLKANLDSFFSQHGSGDPNTDLVEATEPSRLPRRPFHLSHAATARSSKLA